MSEQASAEVRRALAARRDRLAPVVVDLSADEGWRRLAERYPPTP